MASIVTRPCARSFDTFCRRSPAISICRKRKSFRTAPHEPDHQRCPQFTANGGKPDMARATRVGGEGPEADLGRGANSIVRSVPSSNRRAVLIKLLSFI